MDTSFSGQVTVSFHPAVDDRQEVLRAVARAYASAVDHDLPGARPASGEQVVDGWTADLVDRYVTTVTPAARTVLRTILATAPCPTADVATVAAMGPQGYVEALISLEESLRAVPQVRRLPFDVVDGCFTVDPAVAALVARALDRVAGER